MLAVLAVSAIGAAATVGTATELDLGSTNLSHDVIHSSLLAGFIAFLIGITLVTTEWRHGTITRTFLVTPRRERVLMAKELAALIVGVALAVVALALVLAIAVVWLAIDGTSFGFDAERCRVSRPSAAFRRPLGRIGRRRRSRDPESDSSARHRDPLDPRRRGLSFTALLDLVDLERVGDYLPGAALASFEGGADDGSSPRGSAEQSGSAGSSRSAWRVTSASLDAT